jgi:hypothetical protein
MPPSSGLRMFQLTACFRDSPTCKSTESSLTCHKESISSNPARCRSAVLLRTRPTSSLERLFAGSTTTVYRPIVRPGEEPTLEMKELADGAPATLLPKEAHEHPPKSLCRSFVILTAIWR